MHSPTARLRGTGGEAESWNGDEIDWRSFDDARAEATRTRKPIMLVFHASWCGHCRNYSRVFDAPSVVAAARDFVMVKADSDVERELGARFAPDGTYIPRTMFLSPDGVLAPELKAHSGNFQYFYDERDPSDLLAGMARAKSALRR